MGQVFGFQRAWLMFNWILVPLGRPHGQAVFWSVRQIEVQMGRFLVESERYAWARELRILLETRIVNKKYFLSTEERTP